MTEQRPMHTSPLQKAALIFFGLALAEIILQIAGLFLAHPVSKNNDFIGDPRSVRILTIGESTTEWGGANSWPSRLDARLGKLFKEQKIKVYNEGHAGSNTAEMLQRIPIWMQMYRPHIVISLMGINDPWGITITESPVLSKLNKIKLFKLAHLAWINMQASPEKTAELPVKSSHWDSKKYPDPSAGSCEVEMESAEMGQKFAHAESLFLTKNYRDAAGAFLQAMKKAQRRYPKFLFDLGVANYHLGQTEEGDRAFNEYIKLCETSDSYYQVGSFIYFLHGYSSVAGREKAISYLKAGYDFNPNNIDILSLLGTAFRQDPAKTNEALKYLTLCMELGGRNSDTIGSLADVYSTLHRPQDVENVLQIGIAEGDNDGSYWIWDRYIRFLMMENRWDDAAALLQKALGKYPDNYTFRLLATQVGNKLGKQIQEIHQSEAAFDFWALTATKRNYPAIIEQIQLGHAIPVVMQYPRRPVAPLQSLLQNATGVVYVENLRNFESALETKKYEDLFLDRFGQNFGHFTAEGSELIVSEIVRVFEEKHMLDRSRDEVIDRIF